MNDRRRVTLEPGYVLHARAYRDSSRIVDAFTQNHGRVALVAHGIRRPRSQLRPACEPFRLLLISWSGRGSLRTLTAAETRGPSPGLGGDALLGAWYVNELILRLLERDDPHGALFAHYARTLAELSSGLQAARTLRRFEKALLDEVGYGLNLERDIVSAQPVQPDRRYRFSFEEGPIEIGEGTGGGEAFSGASLLALASGELDDDNALLDAHRLLRMTLDRYLGGRPLKTREVARAMWKTRS